MLEVQRRWRSPPLSSAPATNFLSRNESVTFLSPGGHASTARRMGALSHRGKRGVAPAHQRADVGGIAAEELVGALSHQRDLHVLCRAPRQKRGGNPRGIGQRLAHHRDEAAHLPGEVVGLDPYRHRPHTQRARHQRRRVPLVVGGLRESQREGGEVRVGAQGLGHRGHQRRVDAAAQEHAERYVVLALKVHGPAEDRVEAVERCGHLVHAPHRPAPRALAAHRASFEHDALGGGHLADLAKGRRGRGEAPEAHVAGQRLAVDGQAERGIGGKRQDLGGERHTDFRTHVEQGTLTGAVAGENESLVARVVEGDGERADEFLDEVLAQLQIEGRDDRDVGAHRHRATAGGEKVADLLVVVDLAVAHGEHAGICVGDRLPAAVHAANGETGDAEERRGRTADPRVVGAAMEERVHHRLHAERDPRRCPDPRHRIRRTCQGCPSRGAIAGGSSTPYQPEPRSTGSRPRAAGHRAQRLQAPAAGQKIDRVRA